MKDAEDALGRCEALLAKTDATQNGVNAAVTEMAGVNAALAKLSKPKTGESTAIFLLGSVLLLALLGMGYAVIHRRRYN